MQTEKIVILASQSKQRRLLMESLGIPFEIHPADIDEQSIIDKDESRRVVTIARTKACKVASFYPKNAIIAADSVVIYNNRVLEKPTSKEEGREMLRLISGQETIGLTGVVCVWKGKVWQEACVKSYARLRRLTCSEIDRYVDTQPVTTWAGGFSPAYPAGANLLESLNGSVTGYNYGFPMEVIVPWFKKLKLCFYDNHLVNETGDLVLRNPSFPDINHLVSANT